MFGTFTVQREGLTQSTFSVRKSAEAHNNFIYKYNMRTIPGKSIDIDNDKLSRKIFCISYGIYWYVCKYMTTDITLPVLSTVICLSNENMHISHRYRRHCNIQHSDIGHFCYRIWETELHEQWRLICLVNWLKITKQPVRTSFKSREMQLPNVTITGGWLACVWCLLHVTAKHSWDTLSSASIRYSASLFNGALKLKKQVTNNRVILWRAFVGVTDVSEYAVRLAIRGINSRE